jgi:hypothetical protein
MTKLVDNYDTLDNCVELKNFAFSSHVDCYLRPGYGAKSVCQLILSPKNFLALLRTFEVFDFLKDYNSIIQVGLF